LEITTAIISNLEEENELYSDAKFYKTTTNSQIIIEPNYLIDVTEITDCFSFKGQEPIVPIISKFLNRTAGIGAWIGNVVNTFFDELLANIEIDFDTALQNAIKNKPLHLLSILQQTPAYENDIKIFFSLHRADLYDYFDNLRTIIIENYLKNNDENQLSISMSVEPSFISNLYGMQGRLDLMIEKENSDSTTSVDIVELKSNKSPEGNLNIYLGIAEKRKFYLPLWISHYIQIVCYNMLLQNKFSQNKNFVQGFSSILYSKPKEINPIRSVIDNQFIQNEIIIMRN
jgi:hypothetical protein